MSRFDPNLFFFLIVGFVVDALVFGLPRANNSFLTLVMNYQTLTAAIIALIVATPTIWNLHLQRQQKRKVALAALAIHVSKISRYAEECMRLADKHLRNSEEGNSSKIDVANNIPHCSSDTIANLAEAAGPLPEVTARKIAALLHYLQIQQSRLAGFFHDFSAENNGPTLHASIERYIGQIMYDAACLSCLADRLYEPARANRKIKIEDELIAKKLLITVGRGAIPHRW